jgi:MFS family permease
MNSSLKNDLTCGRKELKTIWNKNFICIIFTNALLGIAFSSVNTLVSSYASYMNASAVMIGLLTGLFFGIAFITRPFTGAVTMKMDRRTLMIAIYSLGIFVHLGYAISSSIPMFLVFRFFHGVQYSVIGSLNMTIASDNCPKEKMGVGMGVFGVGQAASMAFGPALGIALFNFGTRLGGESLGYSIMFSSGAAIMALALIPCFLLDSQKISDEALAKTGAWYKNMFAGAALPAAFLILLLSWGYSLFTSYMVPFCNSVGISNSSIFFMVYAAFILISRPLCGKIIDKYGILVGTIPGFIVFIGSLVLVSFSTNIPMLVIAAILASFGYGSAFPALQTMAIHSVPDYKRAVASNTVYSGMDLGLFFGPLVGGTIAGEAGNYSLTYMTGVIPIVIAIVAMLIAWPTFVKRRKKLDANGL